MFEKEEERYVITLNQPQMEYLLLTLFDAFAKQEGGTTAQAIIYLMSADNFQKKFLAHGKEVGVTAIQETQKMIREIALTRLSQATK